MKDNDALQNPRVIVIQKLYSHHLNKESEIFFSKHRYKKFIKDVVLGTIERKDLIEDLMAKELKEDINNNKTELMVKLLIMAATSFLTPISNINQNQINQAWMNIGLAIMLILVNIFFIPFNYIFGTVSVLFYF